MQPLSNYEARSLEVMALGDLMAAYGGPALALQTLKRGGGAADFMRAMSERVKDQPLQAGADAVLGISSGDTRGYSITAAIRAMTEQNWTGASLERNISDLVTTKTDRVPNGVYVPLGLLARDFNVGTASEAGNLLGLAIAGDRAVDPLRKVSVLASLGATFVSGLREQVNIPRFSSSTSAAWGSEVAAATPVLEATASVDLVPKRFAVTMVLSRQALLSANLQLDAAISRHLTAALLELVETDALNGDGTSDSPVGVRNTAGITTVVGGVNGVALAYDHLVDLENGPDSGNCPVSALAGYLVNAKTRKHLRKTERGMSVPEIWAGGDRPLLGYRAGVSNILPGNLEKGSSGAVCSSVLYSADWSNLVIGIYGGGVDLTVDRITLAAEGKVRITAALLVGVGVAKPAAFAKMDDAIIA